MTRRHASHRVLRIRSVERGVRREELELTRDKGIGVHIADFVATQLSHGARVTLSFQASCFGKSLAIEIGEDARLRFSLESRRVVPVDVSGDG